MVISKADWLHILVAFVTWGITGLFIVAADFRINPILKGLIIAFLVSLPMLLVIYRVQPDLLLLSFIMIAMLGPMLGFWLGRINAPSVKQSI